MFNIPIPENEELRLQELHAYNILHSESEKEFDELLEVAARIYGCPMAAITFIDRERQWLKSRKGIHFEETDRKDSFCTHTIMDNKVLVVPDARQDERFSRNRSVTGKPAIRFYAGAPILSRKGYPLGTLCIIDSTPRLMSEEEAGMLAIISRQITRLLELRLINQQVIERAVAEKKQSQLHLHQALTEHEASNQEVSTTLHEDIGQQLAATGLYLELAEAAGTGRNELIRKSRHYINSLVEQVRQLSASLTPTTLQNGQLEELLESLVQAFRKRSGISITYHYAGSAIVDNHTCIHLYRIVESHLAYCARNRKSGRIELEVLVGKDCRLRVKDNGNRQGDLYPQKVGYAKLLSRVEGLGGKLWWHLLSGEGAVLEVTVPVVTQPFQN